MLITAVASTTLATVAYDGVQKLLQLEFRSRVVYHYFGVPATVHEALLDAPSKGSYFNQAIRGRYPYVRVSDLQAAQTSAEVLPQREHPGGPAWHAR
ncbi:MAG: KTSC domain-containing protein [Bryobacterales bacterium]|nr:KTSC domain-containing protein [Bryobacterales bacterium]